MDDHESTAELRLEDLRWLRALARRLVRDPDAADDAVQDTLVAALSRRPASLGSPRGWLASVLRNVVRQERRGAARRERRERALPTRGESPATADVVAELAWHRRLVEHVHALEEPYRRTIVLRFLRGRSPREIARDEGVPVKTVHTRIARALARLRTALDREHGGERNAWVIALAPMTREEGGLLAALGVGSAALVYPMNVKLVAAGLAAAGLLSLPFVLRSEPAPAERTSRAPALAAEPAAPLDMAKSEVDAAPAGERAAIEAPAPVVETPAAAPLPPPRVLTGRVCDLGGAPIADVTVAFERLDGRAFVRPRDLAPARSHADGTFELALAGGVEAPGRLVAEDAFWATVSRPYVGERTDATASDPALVVVAPRRSYEGRVTDEEGTPLAGARVEVGLVGGFLHSREVAGEVVNLRGTVAETRTDAAGVFRFEGIGFVEGARLGAARDGFEEAELALPAETRHDLALVLARSAPPARTIHGLVFDGTGSPAADAEVSFGWNSVRTGPGGRFALPLEDWQDEGILRAVKRGAGATTLAFRLAEEGPGHADEPLTLYLGGASLAIEGKLVDAEGESVAGAIVWTPDVTHFGHVEFAGETTMTGLGTVEALIGGRLTGPWDGDVEDRTDGDGRFELGPLLAREYAVFAIDPETFSLAGPVLAHPDRGGVTLELPPAETHLVAGRVTARDGSPIAGVRVWASRSADWQPPVRAEDPWSGSPIRHPGAAQGFEDLAVTDAEGRFALGERVLERTSLSFVGPELFLASPVRLGEAPDPAALEVVLDARSTFRVALTSPTEADAFRLVTAKEQHQSLFVQIEGSTMSVRDVPLVAGRSSVAFTRSGEHVFVLEKDGREVRRATLVLEPGGVHTVEL